jgi:hypothetical protein
MEDRLDALGGTLHIASSPGHGTTLRATIPLMAAVAALPDGAYGGKARGAKLTADHGPIGQATSRRTA